MKIFLGTMSFLALFQIGLADPGVVGSEVARRDSIGNPQPVRRDSVGSPQSIRHKRDRYGESLGPTRIIPPQRCTRYLIRCATNTQCCSKVCQNGLCTRPARRDVSDLQPVPRDIIDGSRDVERRDTNAKAEIPVL
ncbi:hypothetical protein PTTW11_00005 [Pyrenophora teres f. teres]|uniref:WAP domain-containing protein n=1 Tax=Pyrenophora teres f. teres TaxID=97479 RepID=A0A6S6VSP3_9PLEO|nr:hypothetical protein PTTW11_00005 [Pyrenophora teres f. teres]